jgi:hypothetical protein
MRYFILILIFLSACKKDPDVNPPIIVDPCADAEITTAEFGFYERYCSSIESAFLTDTVYLEYVNYMNSFASAYFIYMEADQKDGYYYHWSTSYGTIYNSFNDQVGTNILGVLDSIGLDSIIVTLIIKRNISSCFPFDDGVDTVSKTLYLKKQRDPYWIGKFEGYNTDNPSHLFTIEFGRVDEDVYLSDPDGDSVYAVKNLPEGYNKFTEVYSRGGISVSVEESCGHGHSFAPGIIPSRPVGYGVMQDGNTIKINYSYYLYPDVNTKYEKTFIGTRVN